MAKDDYDYIVFKILTYSYGVLKHKYNFDKEVFRWEITKDIQDEYLSEVLYMMQEDENLIKGLTFTKAWGGVKILISEYEDIRITVEGIRYLNENARMQRIAKETIEGITLIASLVKTVLF